MYKIHTSRIMEGAQHATIWTNSTCTMFLVALATKEGGSELLDLVVHRTSVPPEPQVRTKRAARLVVLSFFQPATGLKVRYSSPKQEGS